MIFYCIYASYLAINFLSDGYDEPSPVSFMAGSYDTTPSPHHLQAAHHDHYSVPHYASYVQPPLGSDSGSGVSAGGYAPLPPGGFSPVANNKEYQSQQHHLQQQHIVATSTGGTGNATAHEHWNNNDRAQVDTSYDCY